MIQINTQTMYIHKVSFRNIVLKLHEIPTINVPKPDSIGYKAYKLWWLYLYDTWNFRNNIYLFALSLVIYIQFLQSNDMILKIKLYVKSEI